MTERDTVEQKLERLMASETMPEDAIAQTLALVDKARRQEAARQQQAPEAPLVLRRRLPRRRFVQLLAACLALGTLGGAGIALAAETAQVEIDGARTLELGINRWDRVVRAESPDQLVADQAAALRLVGQTTADALACLADDALLRDALGDTDGVAFIVVCNDSSQQEGLITDCSAAAATFGNGSFCAGATAAERHEARQAGMGIARYTMAQRIAALDPSIDVDACRKLPMCQLRELLSQLDGETGVDEEDRCGNGHHRGSGQGMGGQGAGMHRGSW